MKKNTASENAGSPRRTRLFKFIAILLPFIFLLILEGLLRLAGYGDNLKLFVPNTFEGYEDYMTVNPEIGKKYFQRLEYTSPANDIFLKEKPENTFRIFVMGSSVVYGFPYDRNLMFSRILHQQLSDAYPDKEIEMVNTSITAINSFTLRDFFSEILKYDPDAILIYEGHNEFYGAFGIGSNEIFSRNSFLGRIHVFLMNFRLYQLERNLIAGIREKLARQQEERSEGTLMKRIVADQDILLHSDAYNITMKRFTENMTHILRSAKRKKIPVFMSELVSNIQGMEPFNSIQSDTLEAAIEVFRRARMAEEVQEYDTALRLYYRAKDLDCLRFRASEQINGIIKQLCNAHDAYRVPMLDHFHANSPNKLIGNNYMTEHVHPNIDGSFLMAEAFLNTLIASEILGKNPSDIKTRDYYQKNWGYSALDTLLARHRVQSLKGQWPFVLDEKDEVNYLQTYKPGYYLDSLAFTIMSNPSVSLVESRLKLARALEQSGRIRLAYREYESLIRMNPYIAVNYRDAATCLIKLGDLPLALDHLVQSLKYESSFFARFRIGEIYLIMGDYESAVSYFEEALEEAPDDNRANTLGKLYTALVFNRNSEEASKVAAELESMQARQYLRLPPKIYTFNEYIPFQTEVQVRKAKEMTEEGRHIEALELLESSLLVYDSHIANRMLGEIHYHNKEFDKARRYYNSVYELFKFDPGFLHHLVLTNLFLHDTENARKCLNDIRMLHPDYPQLNILSMMLS